MPEGDILLEGRLPERSDEIVISGSFIKENPQYKLGDKLNIILGYRQKEGKNINPLELIHEGEVFIDEKEIEYIIVGVISVKSLSYEPSYIGLGVLNEDLMDENLRMTPFLRMNNPRTVYKDLPEIGKTLGFSAGEESKIEDSYRAVYNTRYLKIQGIFPPSAKLWESVPIVIIVFSILILLVMLLFIIIIYNVFTVWSSNRLKQLGILKSIGATPKQIRKTVIIEAMLLSVIPIPLGILLGHLFCFMMVGKINNIINDFSALAGKEIFELSFKTSPAIVGIMVSFTLLTLLLSVNKPAGRLGKIIPIEAIKRSGLNYEYLKKKKSKNNNYSPSNIIPGLAKDSLNANRGGFRTTIISITISFVIMVIFLVAIGINQGNRYLNTIENYYPINLHVSTNELADEDIYNEIMDIPEIKGSIVYKSVYLYSKIKFGYASEEFRNLGGFESIDNKIYYLEELEGDYEIPVELMGIDHDNFNSYVKSQGGDPEEYYDKEKPRAILLNLVKEDVNQPVVRENYISFLKNTVNNLLISEYTSGMGYSFNIDIALKTYQKPIVDYYLKDYRIYLFVPKEVLNSIMGNFEFAEDYGHSEHMRLLVDEEDVIKAKEDIRDICKYYLPEEDFYIWSILDDEAYIEMQNKIVFLITFYVVFFLGIIGVSNAYSSINNIIKNRRREFAMLKSMGITKDDLKKMLSLEGIYYSIYPFIFSIPICLLFLGFIVKVNRILKIRDLMQYLDYRIIISYIILVCTSIYLAYYFGIKKVENDKVVDVLRDESI